MNSSIRWEKSVIITRNTFPSPHHNHITTDTQLPGFHHIPDYITGSVSIMSSPVSINALPSYIMYK